MSVLARLQPQRANVARGHTIRKAALVPGALNMTCDYCRSINSDADHRCRRCGRRLSGSAVAAPPEYAERAIQALGANALAAAAAATAEFERPAPPAAPPERPRVDPQPKPRSGSGQSSLFAEENPAKVIPFSRRPDGLPDTEELFAPKPPAADPTPRPKAAGKKKAAPFGDQTTLDFLPTASPLKSRTLKTTVEAVIYCDAPVAAPIHRAMAAALDASMIFLGFGIFLVIFLFSGGRFVWNKQDVALFGAALGLISVFYGFVWMMAGKETIGMTWADLRLINFNGFPPDRKSRALRLIGCCLSFCSGMIGIFWALVDEESLTWHDHMSKTFPTLKETNSSFFRQ